MSVMVLVVASGVAVVVVVVEVVEDDVLLLQPLKIIIAEINITRKAYRYFFITTPYGRIYCCDLKVFLLK
jgi:hypothetical protein